MRALPDSKTQLCDLISTLRVCLEVDAATAKRIHMRLESEGFIIQVGERIESQSQARGGKGKGKKARGRAVMHTGGKLKYEVDK